MKKLLFLPIFATGMLLGSPSDCDSEEISFFPTFATGKHKHYTDVSVSSNFVCTMTDTGPLPVIPSVAFGYRSYPDQNSKFGSILESTFSFAYLDRFYPIVEVKVGRLIFTNPGNNSNYFGFATGLSFPRVVPIYFLFGKEYNIFGKNGSKIELELSTSAFPHPWALVLGSNAKISYGFVY